jgi:hypothetical protein
MPEKKIEVKKYEEALNRLDEVYNPVVSLREFVTANFERLQKAGKPLRALYDFLLNSGVDVGSFNYFRKVYNCEKRARKNKSITPLPLEQAPKTEHAAPAKNNSTALVPLKKITEQEMTVPEKLDKTHDAEMGKKEKPIPYGLRPIKLADGSEVKIDPETGARVFDV